MSRALHFRAFHTRLRGEWRRFKVRCPACKGSGWDGITGVNCARCGGDGRIKTTGLHPADAWTLAVLRHVPIAGTR